MDIRTELAWIAGRLGSIGYRGVVGSDVRIAGVSIDSRTDCSGKLFIALEGENHDGNDFVTQAIENGAAAAIVRSGTEPGLLPSAGQVPLLGVQDTLKALQHIATAWLEKIGPKVVGITGSTGKTGTKQLAASIIGTRYRVHATAGNLNNEIGLPLTLLSMPGDTEVLVAEMGASHIKDIKLLASMARPEIGIITNIGPGHLEHFGSIKDVAAAKSELVEALGEGMTAVLPIDDEFFEFMTGRTKARVVSFGFGEGADYRITQVVRKEGPGYTFDLSGTSMETNRYGRHHLLNTAAAVAAAGVLGITPGEASASVSEAGVVEGRGDVYDIAGITFVDDSYNSNPSSLKAAVEAFMEMPSDGRRWLVLGDMLEFGEASAELHAEMGAFCGKAGVDGLLTLGTHSMALSREAAVQRKAPENVSHFLDAETLAAYLDSFLGEGDLVLVKGSRSMKTEKVIGEIERLRKVERRRVD